MEGARNRFGAKTYAKTSSRTLEHSDISFAESTKFSDQSASSKFDDALNEGPRCSSSAARNVHKFGGAAAGGGPGKDPSGAGAASSGSSGGWAGSRDDDLSLRRSPRKNPLIAGRILRSSPDKSRLMRARPTPDRIAPRPPPAVAKAPKTSPPSSGKRPDSPRARGAESKRPRFDFFNSDSEEDEDEAAGGGGEGSRDPGVRTLPPHHAPERADAFGFDSDSDESAQDGIEVANEEEEVLAESPPLAPRHTDRPSNNAPGPAKTQPDPSKNATAPAPVPNRTPAFLDPIVQSEKCRPHSDSELSDTRRPAPRPAVAVAPTAPKQPLSNHGSRSNSPSLTSQRSSADRSPFGGGVQRTLNLNGRSENKTTTTIPNRMLHSPKKSPSKAHTPVYNVRSWATERTVPKTAPPASDSSVYMEVPNRPSSGPTVKRSPGFQDYDDAEYEGGGAWGDRSSVRVPRDQRKLYTVVRNVKQAHECLESGETQQFFDDIAYLLEGLGPTEPVSTRCLSTLSLAEKCTEASFRMYVRAHGCLQKIFTALEDATKYPGLAFCSSAVLYTLSRDRLSLQIDQSTLDLLLELLDVDGNTVGPTGGGKKLYDPEFLRHDKEYAKSARKFRHSLAKMTDPTSKSLPIDEISCSVLAMETLLSLCSQRVPDWLKDEIRLCGALDRIVYTVDASANRLHSELTKDDMKTLEKICRCLRAIENLTMLSQENQKHVVTMDQAVLLAAITRSLLISEQSFCQRSGPSVDPGGDGGTDLNNSTSDSGGSPPQQDRPLSKKRSVEDMLTIEESLLSILKVLLNLTHDNEYGSTKLGNQQGLISSMLKCVLLVPQYVRLEKRFDIVVLGLGVLINLVEHSAKNRRVLWSTYTVHSFDLHSQPHVTYLNSQQYPPDINKATAIEALLQLFLIREAAARFIESHPDDSLCQDDPKTPEGSESDRPKLHESTEPSEELIKRTLTKVLNKAGKHMEDSMVASYVALLVGFLIQDSQSQDWTEDVRTLLPDGDFNIMIKMLEKFLTFIDLTDAVNSSGLKSVSRVIRILQSCK